MAEMELIEVSKIGDIEGIERLMNGGTDINERDKYGWTALSWAAGKGDAPMVELLLKRGADPTSTGRDGRTALTIARAANRWEVVRILTETGEKSGMSYESRAQDSYCKPYVLRELRRFEGWSENATLTDTNKTPEAETSALADDQIVYLHQDFTVTKSMWHGEEVVFDRITPEWTEFCGTVLGFTAPEYLR